ncbi:MAG: transcription termination/antitermination protein NusG [Candidatus Paceibacterota bacterium]
MADNQEKSKDKLGKEGQKNVKQLLADGKPHWYAIHTYAGYEDAVCRNLKQRTESLGMEDRIFDVVVPTKQVVKVRRGKRVEEEERIYPGYVLVKMIVTDDSWYVVRNTPRVTGFVGSGVHPVPLKEEEVQELFRKMKGGETEHDIDLEEGDVVTIIDGPFKEMEGKIQEVDRERGRVKVFVSMFGRETPVELDFLQVNKI